MCLEAIVEMRIVRSEVTPNRRKHRIKISVFSMMNLEPGRKIILTFIDTACL